MLKRTLIIAGTVLTLAAGGAMAQDMGHRGGSMMEQHMTHMCGDIDARLASKLAYYDVKLGVTEAQRPAWRKLADQLKAASEPVRKLCAEVTAQPEAATMPARLERMQKMSEAHAAALKSAVPALEQFYATLSADQKKVADGLGGAFGMCRH
jgi:sirohydrochlorin ferrochelatase